MDTAPTMKLYTDLTGYWKFITAPEDYVEEAAFFRQTLESMLPSPPREVLELGSGGGNNASHLKAHYRMTLVDVSPRMLEVSQRENPECEHILGDMRTVRLGRQFDAVFIHDAVIYMTTPDDLRRALETAALHCKPGRAVLIAPDFVRENFRPAVSQHGDEEGARALYYLEWTQDPDPSDTTYVMDFACLVRDDTGRVQCVHDHHVCGLFRISKWLDILRDVGFEPRDVPSPVNTDQGGSLIFVGLKR